MSREIIHSHIARLQVRYLITDDYIECKIIQAQIELLQMLLEAIP